MGEHKPHKRLQAWQQAMDLVVRVYEATGPFPASERYVLIDQMRRATVSIPSNIAEGAARQTKREFAQFLHMARGSLSELDTQLEIAFRLGYLPAPSKRDLEFSLEGIDRILNGLVASLNGDKETREVREAKQ